MYSIFNDAQIYMLYGGATKVQWKSLEHNGPMFPPEYVKHNIPILIKGNKYILSAIPEEYATLYSRYLGSVYIENNTFNKNFWTDFKKVLPVELLNKVKGLEDIDFSLFYNYIVDENEKKKNMTPDEKLKLKIRQDKIEEPYKYCKIDGYKQTVGNYKIEPPGIFIGRGNHPKMGMLKKRLRPNDVIINISDDAIVQKPNIKGEWGGVIHDNTLIWLASWKDEINNKTKYIFTSFESIFKSKSDEEKFDLAKKLKSKVSKIRKQYMEHALDPDIKLKQLATALYLIDKLALRAGCNKDTSEQADTVGVTSLRVEHIKLLKDNTVELDFLGKDSIRYYKKIKVDDVIYNNIDLFMNNKNKKDELFNNITHIQLNKYLNDFMENLTSKVWRTYNASFAFQERLNAIDDKVINKMEKNEKINYLIMIVNQANTDVALLCNHQKAVSTSLDKQLKLIDERIKTLADKLKKSKEKDVYKSKIKMLKLKKETKIKMQNVSLGTSKNNYIDPRIIFSFMKKYDIPFEKLFTKKLIERFTWASSVDDNYKF